MEQELVNNETERKNMFEVHDKVALQEIFGISVDSKTLKIIQDEKDESQRYGIITYAEGKPTFTHRSFAEYFVATSIINKLPDFDRDVFCKIIFNPESYEFIISLIEKKLKFSNEPEKIEKMHKAFAEFIDAIITADSEERFFLHCHIRDRRFMLAEFLLKSTRYCKEDTIKLLLTSQVEGGYNIFMLACRYWQRACVDIIWSLAKQVYQGNVKGYFLIVDNEKLNVFQSTYLLSCSDMPFWENSIMKILRRVANDILQPGEQRMLIVDGRYRRTTNSCSFWEWTADREKLINALKLKWDIACKFAPDLSASDIIEGDNLFTFSILRAIESTSECMKKFLEDWAKNELSSENSEKFFERFSAILAANRKLPSRCTRFH